MSLYRCGICGSSNVVLTTKNEGYSVAKGILGTALFGTGGAVMGVNGKKSTCYHCNGCGRDLNSVMPEFIKNTLDNYLKDPTANEKMLEQNKIIYPNLEWEKPIKIESQELEKKTNKTINTNEDLASAIWEYYLETKNPFMSLNYIRDHVIGENWSNIPAEVHSYKAMDILARKGLVTHEKNGEYLFYSNAEDIKKNIDNYQNKEYANELYKSKSQEFIAMLRDILRIKQNISYKEFKPLLLDSITKKYGISNTGVLNYLVNIIIKSCYYEHHVKIEVGLEPTESILKYRSEEETEKIKKEIELKRMEREQEREKERSLKDEEEYKKYSNEIIRVLKDNKPRTITELQLSSGILGDITLSKIMFVLKRMCEDGKVEKEARDKKSYFSLPR